MSATIEVTDGRIHVTTTYLEMLEKPRSRPMKAPLEQIAVLHAERPTASFYRYLYETVGSPWLWWERRLWTDEALRAVTHDPFVEITVLHVRGVPAGFVELDARATTEDEEEAAPAEDAGSDDDDDDEDDAPGGEADRPQAIHTPLRDPRRSSILPEAHAAAAVVGGGSRKGSRPSERPWQGRDVELAYFGLIPDFIGRGLGRYFLHWAVDRAWYQGADRLWVHTCNLDHPRALMTYQRAGFAAYRQETSEVDDPRPWMTGRAPMPAKPSEASDAAASEPRDAPP